MNTITLKDAYLKINNKGYFINKNTFNRWNEYQIEMIVENLKHINVADLFEMFEYDFNKIFITYNTNNGERTLIISDDKCYDNKTEELYNILDDDLLYELIDFLKEGVVL